MKDFLLTFGKGHATYILAFLAIVYGIYGSISGSLDQSQALEVIWIGLAAFGIRRALPQ